MSTAQGKRGYFWHDDPTWREWNSRARTPSQMRLEVSDGVVIHCYQSGHDPYFTGSYYFETERGVVLVDTQLFYSSVKELWQQIQATTSGNLYCIVNTHAHSDHYYGNAYLKKQAPGALVISSRAVMADFERTFRQRCAKTRYDWGEEVFDHPDQIVAPNLLFEKEATLRFDNITLELRDMIGAEAPVQVIGWIPEARAIVAADILQNQQHLYFVDRLLGDWYKLLEEFQSWDPAWCLTGHQGIAGPELIAETKRWIATYYGLMAKEVPFGADIEDVDTLDEAGRARVLAGMTEAFPEWYDPYFHDGWTVMQTCLAGARSEVVGAAVMDHGHYRGDDE